MDRMGDSVKHNFSTMDWNPPPTNLYVEALTLNAMVFGDEDLESN